MDYITNVLSGGIQNWTNQSQIIRLEEFKAVYNNFFSSVYLMNAKFSVVSYIISVCKNDFMTSSCLKEIPVHILNI